MEKLLQEIERRIIDRDGRYAIIGTEFRSRRLALKKTLKFLAYKICSISYASKIESNDIIPNDVVLREISSRLGMDQKQIDSVLSLREAMESGVKAILTNNIEILDTLAVKCREFENYRSMLFQFLYYTVNNNMEAATAMHTELINISTTMTNFDFNIFVVIEGIYYFKIGNIVEGFKILKSAENLPLFRNLKNVLHLYLFYSSNVLCSPDTIYYYNFIKEELFSMGSYDLLDEVQYYLAIYHIKHNSLERARDICNSIKNVKRKNSILLLIAYLLDKPIKAFSRKKLIKIARCIYDYKHNQEGLVEDAKEYDGYYQLDYNSSWLEYISLENDIQRYNFIINNVSNELLFSQDKYLRDYFINQLWKITERTGKYRVFYDGYEKLVRKE